MHWVWATSADDGKKIPVNLAVLFSMLPVPAKEAVPARTVLFLGGITQSIQGQVTYASTHVLETPDELFALPVIEVGPKPMHPALKAVMDGVAFDPRQGLTSRASDFAHHNVEAAPKPRKAARK